jgi:putative nucleotidyltransferase with HDIG domain
MMLAAEAAAGLAAVAIAAADSSPSQWDKPWLVITLLGIAIASDTFAVIRGPRDVDISGAFLAIVLAMALVGPTGAVAVAVISAAIDGLRHRKSWMSQLNNVSTYAVFPLAGAFVLDRMADALGADIGSAGYALALAVAFIVSLGVNFALVAVHQRVIHGRSIGDQVKSAVVPFLPSEALTAALAATVVSLYPTVGFAVVVLVTLVLLGFQYMLRELERSRLRAERLRAIQVDVLFSLVRALSLRDQMTARHSAAVARYAKAIARAAGASPHEQRLVHTAGLLHDIGKSIFPDHVLFADGGLTDEQWLIVRQHPEHGAALIAQIEEFKDVAELVASHHERLDGRGYPLGLAGEDVPWLSRMLSIADTYDVMTARDSYREPVSPEEAIAELRRVSGTQLDGDLVEIFVEVLAREAVQFAHADDADFERELEEERRRTRESGVHVLATVPALSR